MKSRFQKDISNRPGSRFSGIFLPFLFSALFLPGVQAGENYSLEQLYRDRVETRTSGETGDLVPLGARAINPLSRSARSDNQRNTAAYLERVQSEPLTLNQQRVVDSVYALESETQIRSALSEISGGGARSNTLMMGVVSPWNIVFHRIKIKGPDQGYGGSPWRRTTLYQSPYRSVAPGEILEETKISPEEEDLGGFYSPSPNPYFSGNHGFESGEIYYEGPVSSPYTRYGDGNADPVEVQEIVLLQYFGQCPTIRKINFWVNPYYNSMDVGGDGNSPSYVICRTGVLFGGHQQLGKHSVFGIVIGYSDPELSQYHARATANDYHIGFYGGTLIKHKYELKGYIGFGHQEYTMRRDVQFDGFSDVVRGRTQGENFAMSFQLTRPLHAMYFGGFWRPHIAIDVHNVNQDGFTESGDSAAFQYNDASLTKTYFRIGVDREIRRCCWTYRAGLSYSSQWGGKSAPESSGQFVGVGQVPGLVGVGANTARDYITGNFGLERTLNRSGSSSLFFDYNVHASEKETDQTIALGFRWMM